MRADNAAWKANLSDLLQARSVLAQIDPTARLLSDRRNQRLR